MQKATPVTPINALIVRFLTCLKRNENGLRVAIALAGKDTLNNVQGGTLNNTYVGRNDATFVQNEDVSRHDRFRRLHSRLPLAENGRYDGRQFPQSFHRLVSTMFLREL